MESNNKTTYIKPIESTEIPDLLRPDNRSTHIYRGMNNIGKFAIIQGDMGNRISRMSTNRYTKIIDNNIIKESKKYPLRSKSIICSTNINTAKRYGDSTYIVIPCTNTIVGQCKANHDKLTMGKLTMTTMDWDKVWNKANIPTSVNESEQLANNISNIINDRNNKTDIANYIRSIFNGYNILDEINSAYSIKSHGMTFGTLKNINLCNNSEVWIGSACILIRSDEIDNICR